MEKVLKENMPGVMELGREELKRVNGGGGIIATTAGFLGAALLGCLALEVIKDGSAKCWEDFKEGYNRAREGR